MENYLYFAEDPVETGGANSGCDPESALLPVSSYLGCDPSGTGSTAFKFMSCNGTSGVTTITLSHGTNENKSIIDSLMRIMNSYPHTSGYIIVADSEVIGSTKKAEYHPMFRGKVTSVAITDTKSCGGG